MTGLTQDVWCEELCLALARGERRQISPVSPVSCTPGTHRQTSWLDTSDNSCVSWNSLFLKIFSDNISGSMGDVRDKVRIEVCNTTLKLKRRLVLLNIVKTCFCVTDVWMTECQSKLDLIWPSKTDWIFWAKNRHKKRRVARTRLSVSVSVSRSCVLCLWRHGAGCVPAPSPVRPPLACLFSVKSLRRRAVTVCAQETGQGGTAGSAQSLVPVRGGGGGR